MACTIGIFDWTHSWVLPAITWLLVIKQIFTMGFRYSLNCWSSEFQCRGWALRVQHQRPLHGMKNGQIPMRYLVGPWKLCTTTATISSTLHLTPNHCPAQPSYQMDPMQMALPAFSAWANPGCTIVKIKTVSHHAHFCADLIWNSDLSLRGHTVVHIIVWNFSLSSLSWPFRVCILITKSPKFIIYCCLVNIPWLFPWCCSTWVPWVYHRGCHVQVCCEEYSTRLLGLYTDCLTINYPVQTGIQQIMRLSSATLEQHLTSFTGNSDNKRPLFLKPARFCHSSNLPIRVLSIDVPKLYLERVPRYVARFKCLKANYCLIDYL